MIIDFDIEDRLFMEKSGWDAIRKPWRNAVNTTADTHRFGLVFLVIKLPTIK